ncbi:MAG: DUF547 domain-containing protein [Cyclobacteriaceae bacterium]|nr:DUF547 domain-containing protein [Cyclobacteriaceae bacterium]MCH8516361.1 DUF547 domain-containing protein [Cyclobacteriaceae bacterium]
MSSKGKNIRDQFIEESIAFLESSRQANTEPKDSLNKFKAFKLSDFKIALEDPSDKLCFWINIYNGLVLMQLKHRPKEYDNKLRFFQNTRVYFYDFSANLNFIEHAILRRSQFILGLGYIRKWWVGKIEKSLRVDQLDYRIHFALNCGAVSCPPIRSYSPEKLDQQLDNATQSFLQGSKVDMHHSALAVSRIFLWYLGDFGGMRGIKELHYQYGLISSANLKIRFQTYDWSMISLS